MGARAQWLCAEHPLHYGYGPGSPFAKLIEAGGKVLKPVADQFYGDRSGTLADPFGHVWTIGTHKQDIPPEELARRAAAMHERTA